LDYNMLLHIRHIHLHVVVRSWRAWRITDRRSFCREALNLLRAVCVATALVAVACVEGPVRAPAGSDSRRLQLLGQGIKIRTRDPARAAELLAEAGSGAVLERVRVEIWLTCLAQTSAGSAEWRRLLAAQPPEPFLGQALLGLGRALLSEGNVATAVTALEAAASPDADEELLGCPEPQARLRAAERLARSHPQRLRRSALALEREVLAGLDHAGWLARSAAWRQLGETGQVISELSAQRWPGDGEKRRRIELARALTEHGSPQRALDLVPARGAGSEELLVRALAYRRQGWQRFPRASARAPFASCLVAARQAARGLADEPTLLHEALRLTVECGTEAGMIEPALDAWWRLAAADWQHRRRDWYGRRLGVAVAQSRTAHAALPALASSLPDHARCLSYWAGQGPASDRRALAELAEPKIADLYGQWARAELGRPAPTRLHLPEPAGLAPPPQTVRWLQDWGAPEHASAHWQRLRKSRGSSPAETLAAASFEADRGRPDLAIICLRAGCPELGTVAIAEVPADLVRAYLPLRWPENLKEAAREAGLEPWLVAGLARQESLFNPVARSPRGAIGLLQLIPSTAHMYRSTLGLSGRINLTDPDTNLRIGARMLSDLISQYGAIEPALAAYNAGPGRVRRWLGYWPDRHRFTEAVPFYETYTYVRRVTYLAEAYRLVYQEQWEATP
jgi:soluble lytic murein transglycosylase